MARAETLDGHQQAVKIREDIGIKRKQCLEAIAKSEKRMKLIYLFNLNLDGSGNYNIQTGLNYLDHLLEQFSKHGSIDLNLTCLGDLEIDEHHTIEDIAIALGTAINNALGRQNWYSAICIK